MGSTRNHRSTRLVILPTFKMKFGQSIILVLGCIGVSEAATPQISPRLDPKSDKKFFGPPFPADYPDDYQLKNTHLSKNFKHPYPVVQESNVFDTDYVKDENGDNGEWKAQYEYDQTRMKLRKEKKDVDEVAKKVHEQEEEHDLKKKVEDADKKVKEAEKDKEDADDELSE